MVKRFNPNDNLLLYAPYEGSNIHPCTARISSPVVVWPDEVHHVEEHGGAGDDPLGAGDQGVLHPQLVLHGGLLDVRGHCGSFTFDKCLFFSYQYRFTLYLK